LKHFMNKSRVSILILILAAIGIFVWMTMNSIQHVNLLIVNAKVYTVDSHNSIAQAVAIRGDVIVAVGSTDELRRRYTADTTIDASGHPIFPGFIDSHAHIVSYGAGLFELNLDGTTSLQQILELVAEKARTLPPGSWIRGRGWDQNRWKTPGKEKPFPTAEMLDNVSPNNPVILSRTDEHAVWVNSYALHLCGMAPGDSSSRTEVEGGKVVRDARGGPTGIFIDNAIGLIAKYVPPYTMDELKQAIELTFDKCLTYGVTSVGDMGIDDRTFEAYKELLAENKFPLRIYAAADADDELWPEMLKAGPYEDPTNHLILRAVKIWLDGALGSRGAALIEPYSDDPGNRGLTLISSNDMLSIINDAIAHGFQVCTHAIGDRANNIALNVYGEAFRSYHGDPAALRFRIEHAQVLDPSDIPRFKKLGVIPSMQPTHCTSDMYWAEARLGPRRILGAYAWQSLLKDGNIIAAGSDFPVESPNPLLGFYAAITRQDTNGLPRTAEDVARFFQLSADGIKDSSQFLNGWYSNQKMTREEALKAFTVWGAYGQFEERSLGSIESGKRADIVMLSDDIMTIEPLKILSVRVLATIAGGKVRYRVPGEIPKLAFH
jgi:predicted amidohydrolase YtcJ